MSNFPRESLRTSLDFLTELLNRFNEIKILGANDDEEIDSLEHAALFYQDAFLASSPFFLNSINAVDRMMLHLYL